MRGNALCVDVWLMNRVCVCVAGWDWADRAGCVKERQWGMETCSAKEQPSFLTHLPCLHSPCQPGALCVCVCVHVCFGMLSAQLVFWWQLVLLQALTHRGVCVCVCVYFISVVHLIQHHTHVQTSSHCWVCVSGCVWMHWTPNGTSCVYVVTERR